MRVSTTFDVCKGRAGYACICTACGKCLHRTVVVEQTVNPFNKKQDGTPRTRAEVYMAASVEAARKAAELEGSKTVCRDCEEAPNLALLLEFASEPERYFPEPADTYGGAWGVLNERKQIEKVWARCTCGEPCCGGHRPLGWRITRKGVERARQLQEKAVA